MVDNASPAAGLLAIPSDQPDEANIASLAPNLYNVTMATGSEV
jgi:hypothetical protein